MNIQRALEGAGDLSVHPSVSALHIPASHAFIPFQHFSGISVPESVARSRPDDNNNKTVVSVVAAVSGLCPALPVVSMQHQSQIPQAVVATPAIIPAVVAPVAVQTTGTFAPSGPSDMGSIGIAPPQPSGSSIALTCSIGNPAAVSENNIVAVGSTGGNIQKSSSSTSPPSNKAILTSGGISAANLQASANVSGSNPNNSSSSPAKSSKVNASSTNSNSSTKVSNNSSSSSSHNLTQEQTDDLVKPVFRDGELVLEVECGQNKGILYLSKLCQGSKGPCISFQNSWLTPNEFQFVSGRETAKDWKRSIRHHGKSLKLLLAKGILNVHPTMCDCDGCRQGATLTRKGEKRRIPNGERKIRKPSNNNNNNTNAGINGNITNGANSNHNNSSHNVNSTNNNINNNSNNNNNNNSKLPASGGPENPASGPFRPMGSAIVPCQLSPGGAAAKPDVKRPGVDKAPKVADTLPRFPTELATNCQVFPSSKASLLPIAPHGLMVSANIGNQGVVAGQSSSSSASVFSPIKISPPTSASSSSSSSSPSPTLSTTPQPLPLSMPTVSLPFSSSASSLLFSSASKPNQPASLFSLADSKNGDGVAQASRDSSVLSPKAKESLDEEEKCVQKVEDSASPEAIKTNEVDEHSCDEDDDIEEDESASKVCVKDNGGNKENELEEKMEEDAEAVSDSEDCVETNGEDIAKSDVSFESSDEEAEVSESPKQTSASEDTSKPVSNIVRGHQETLDNDTVSGEEAHPQISETPTTSVENLSHSPSVTQSISDATQTLPYSSSVPSQPSLSTLSSPATLAAVMSSATMSVSSLAGTCSQTASTTMSNNVKSEHIWVPPTLAHTRDTDKEQSHSSPSVSSSVSVKTDPTSVGGSRSIQHPVSSQEEGKVFSTRNPPSHQKFGKEGEFNFRSVRDLCAPVKKESPDAKLLSPTLSSHNNEKNREREREEREREREEKQRQRLREERNRKDKEREERRERERREERERESERRRAEERRDHGRSQSEIGNKHDAPPSSVTPAMNLDPLRRPPGGASEAAAFSDYMRVLAASHGNAFLPPSPAAYMQPMLSLRPPDPRMASQLLSPLAASYSSSLGGLPKDPLLYPGTSNMMSGMAPPGLPQIHPFLQRPPYAPSQPSVLDYQRSLAASAAAYSWPSPYSYLIPDIGAAAAAAAAASASLKRPSSELEAAMDLNAKRMRLEGRQTELGSHWDYLAAAAAAQRPQMPSLPCGLESANVDKTTEYLRKRYMEYGPQAAYLSALPEYARTMYHCACAEHRDDDIRLWNVEDVCKFLSSLDGCAIYADHFREQRVDGRILALLSTDHLMKTLGMKLGPAVLLYEAVAKKLQEISKMANCEACRNIALSQPLPPMALPL